MSINKIFSNKDAITYIKYNMIFSKFGQQLNSSSSIEKKIAREGTVLKYIESLDKMEFEELTEFDQLRLKEVTLVENLIKDSLAISNAQSDYLLSESTKNSNEITILLNGVIGKIKRIKQKQAALDLWDDSFVKYAFSEKFYNYDQIDYSLISGNKMNLETKQGVLTLPIESESKVTIKSASIQSGNGNPGNSDLEVEYSSLSLRNILDGKKNTWFEYERLDEGPVKLKLSIELEAESIVNYIEMFPYFSDGTFEIKDISFSGNSRDYTSIKNLSVVESDSYYIPKQVSGGEIWNINFLPIKCKTITIDLESSFTGYIKAEMNGRVVERKRYSVGLKEVVVKKIKYAEKGSVNSKAIDLIENVYAGEYSYRKIPQNESLYSCKMDVSTNNGKSWDSNETFLIEDEGVLRYKLIVERNGDAFATSSSYLEAVEKVDLRNKKKMCSKKISPNIISINEKTTEDDIFVYQDSGLIRSNKRSEAKTVYTHRRAKGNFSFINSSRNTIKVFLKLDLTDYNVIGSDIEVYVDDELFGEISDYEDLNEDENTYYIDNDFSHLVFSRERIERNSIVKIKAKPEELNFFKKEKKYYARFSNFFNPNKSGIDIECLSGKRRKVVQTVKKNKSLIKLDVRGVDRESIKFLNVEGISFSAVAEKREVREESGSIKFNVNERKGLVHLPKVNLEKSVKLEYEVNEIFNVEDYKYEVWFENGEPKGIIIDERFLISEDVEEEIRLTLNSQPKYSLRENRSYSREDYFKNNRRVFTLKNSNIIGGTVRVTPGVFGLKESEEIYPSEVSFIDGESEFLNLKKITSEKTNSIKSDTFGKVEFKLAAGAKYYSKLGLTFEGGSLTNQVNSISSIINIGDYFVDSNGLVTGKIGIDEYLEEEINMEYYYSEPDDEKRYQFSIDYPNGILYLSEFISSNSSLEKKVFYKTSSYTAGYQIVDKIKNFKYNKEAKRIEVDAESLSDKSNTLNVAYLVRSSEVSLEELKEYFTPFIDKIDFRFR